MKLKELLDDHQTGHSEFQDDYFITVQAGGTLYGMYKQSLRELYRRFRGLRQLTCSYERLKIDIEELKEKHDKMNLTHLSFEDRKILVDLKEKVMSTEEAERAISSTKREFNRFYQQASYFKSQIGELTDEKRNKLEREMWEFKIKEMAIIDWVTNGRLRNTTFEVLHALPKDMKIRIGLELADKNALMDWYDDKEYHMPEKLPGIKYDNTLID